MASLASPRILHRITLRLLINFSYSIPARSYFNAILCLSHFITYFTLIYINFIIPTEYERFSGTYLNA